MRKVLKFPLNKKELRTRFELSVCAKLRSAIYHKREETIVLYIETDLETTYRKIKCDVLLVATGENAPDDNKWEFFATVHIPIADEYWHVYVHTSYDGVD